MQNFAEDALERIRDNQIPNLAPPTTNESPAKNLENMWSWMKRDEGFLQHLNNVRVPIQKHIPGILASMTAREVITAAQNTEYLEISDAAKTALANVNLGCWTLLEAGQALNEERKGIATKESRIGHATSIGSYVAGIAVANGFGAAGAVSEVGLMINLYIALRDSYNAYALTKTNVHNPVDAETGKNQLSTSLLALMGAVYGAAVAAFSPAQNIRSSHEAADTVLGKGQTLGRLMLAGLGDAGATVAPDVIFDTAIAYAGAYTYGVRKGKTDGTSEIVKGAAGMRALKVSLNYQRVELKTASKMILTQQGTTGMARGALLQSYNAMTPLFNFIQEKTLGLGQHANALAILGKTAWYGATVSQEFLMRPYLLKPKEQPDVEGAGERSQVGVFQPVRTIETADPQGSGVLDSSTRAMSAPDVAQNIARLDAIGAGLATAIRDFVEENPVTGSNDDKVAAHGAWLKDVQDYIGETSEPSDGAVLTGLGVKPLGEENRTRLAAEYLDFQSYLAEYLGVYQSPDHPDVMDERRPQ